MTASSIGDVVLDDPVAGAPDGRRGVDLPTFTWGSGSPVVFLPGLSLTHETPRGMSRLVESAQLGALAARHRVLWLGRRPHVPEGFTIADFAADCATLLRDRFAGPVPVVGFSTGGFVAMSLAADHPDVVERLVVVAAGARLSASGRAAELRWIEHLESGELGSALRDLAGDVTGFGLAQRALAPVLGWFGSQSGPVDAQDGIATARADLAFDATARLGAVEAPTLLVAGERDPSVDLGQAAATAAAIGSAELFVVRRASHLGTLLHPAAIRRTNRFLAARSAG